MTVLNTISRNQYIATSGQTIFPFTFEVFVKEDIAVLKNGVLLAEGTNYTVSGVGSDPGGNVTLTVGATAGDVLTIYRDMGLQRETDYQNSGDFLAQEVNDDFDRLWLATQQLDGEVNRAIVKPVTDLASIDMTLPSASDRAESVLGFSATGAPVVGPTVADVTTIVDLAADIQTLADIEDGTVATDAISDTAAIAANVTTVANISSNVTTVAGNTTNINTVAGDLVGVDDIGTVATNIANVNATGANIADVVTVSGINADVTTVADNTANVTTVAGVSTNVTTVAGISADVTTVAGISADVTTVAGISADVTTAAINVADITNFADVYQGGKTADPSLRNDGSALQDGDLYFNTTNDVLRVYSNSIWRSAVSEQGIPVWDPSTVYPVNALVKGSDGTVYKALSEQSGNDPVSSPSVWFNWDVSQRTLYVESVVELESLYLEAGINVYLTQEGRAGEFVVKAGTPPSDPQKGIYIVLANGNYAERSGQGKYLDVKVFGAVGDGVADDEIPIAEAIKFSDRFKIYFSAGTYLVGESVSKVPPAGSYLEFDPNALIVQAENSSSTVILVRNRNNTFVNPRIKGAKNNPAGNAVVNAHLITVAITDTVGNTKIIGGNLIEAAGDGLYVNGCDGLFVNNLVCDDNKRQGMSIVDGENIFCCNSTFSNTSGALPGMGLDVEPNLASDKLKNIVFYKCNFFGNEGVDVSPLYNAAQDDPVSVTLDTCEVGFCRIRSVVGGSGTVKLKNCTSFSSPNNSLLCQGVNSDIRIEVNGLYSMDAGVGATDATFGSAVSFHDCTNVNFHGRGITLDETNPATLEPVKGVNFSTTAGKIYMEVDNRLNNDFSTFPRRPFRFSGLDTTSLDIDFHYTPNPFIEPPSTFATIVEAEHFAYRNMYDDKAGAYAFDFRTLNVEADIPNFWVVIRKDKLGPSDGAGGDLTRVFNDNFYPGEIDKVDLSSLGQVIKVRGNSAFPGSLFLEGIQIDRFVQAN